MSNSGKKPFIGAIEWRDLTVDNAVEVRDFYSSVVGWEAEGVSMGDYQDFNMNLPATGETVSGVCHARGSNKALPPQWLIYVRVANVVQSAAKVVELGGQVIEGPRSIGSDTFCVIKDPAGAVLALISS